jgi:glycosyltransferase involved in cell wall biosynthesis
VRERFRLLVLLPQLPDDPASGASRTVTTIAGLMAAAGFEVEAIATTANEGHRSLTMAESLAYLGVSATSELGLTRFARRDVQYSLLDAGSRGVAASVEALAPAYDRLVDEVMSRFRPHLALIYGGSRVELERQRRVRDAGAKVVFGLYNMRSFKPKFFDYVDAVISPSQFLSQRYREVVGLESLPLAGPLWPDDVMAERRHPKFVTMVNPTLDNGLMVFVAIAKSLAEQHPHIPIEVFTTRSSARALRQAAILGGADLERARVTIRPTVSLPRLIYEEARVVLVPTLREDPAPQVVAEAFVNGAVVLGSDRGGIPEMCAQAGFVIPVPRTADSAGLKPVAATVAQPWVDVIADLFGDGQAWRRAVGRGFLAGASYLPTATMPKYARFFARLAGLGPR